MTAADVTRDFMVMVLAISAITLPIYAVIFKRIY
jgi:hypothetical protein